MYQQRPQQPDLDQILQQLKDTFGRIFGRLGGGGVSAVVILVILAGIGLWLFSGVYRIQANEQGVVRLFGARASVQDPGLGWRLPSPITTLVKVDVEQIRTAEIGFRTDLQGLVSRLLDEALMLTTDNSIVEAQLVIQYRIGDPEAFVYNVTNPEDVLHTTAEVALRSIVGRTELDDFLTVGRASAELETRAFLEELLTVYGTGIVLTDVKLQTVDPPDQVKDAFQEVVRALEDETRLEGAVHEPLIQPVLRTLWAGTQQLHHPGPPEAEHLQAVEGQRQECCIGGDVWGWARTQGTDSTCRGLDIVVPGPPPGTESGGRGIEAGDSRIHIAGQDDRTSIRAGNSYRWRCLGLETVPLETKGIDYPGLHSLCVVEQARGPIARVKLLRGSTSSDLGECLEQAHLVPLAGQRGRCCQAIGAPTDDD